MREAMNTRIKRTRYGPETACSIFMFLINTLYLLLVPVDGYVIIAEWKYTVFLILSLGFIVITVEQKLIIGGKADRNWRNFDIFSLSLLSYFLITCFSGVVSPYSGTFLGNGRHEGILTIGLYIVITLLLVRYLHVKNWMLFVFGAAITVFCMLGIVQLTGANPFCLYPDSLNFYDAGNYYMGQYWSTVGNTNLCAALLSTAVGTFTAASVRADKKTDFLNLVPLSFSVFCIVELNSEAGLAALIAGLLLMPLFVVTRGKYVANLILTYGAIFIVLAISFFTVFFDGGVSFAWNNCVTTVGAVALILLSCGWLMKKTEILNSIKPTTLRKFLLGLTLGFVCIGFCTLYFYDRFPDGFLSQAHELLHGNWDDSYGSNRLYIWRQVWDLVWKSPIFGGGPDTLSLRGLTGFSRYNEATGMIVKGSIDAAHNEYLNILVNQGVLALAAYLTAIFTSMVSWWKNPEDDAKVVAGAAALFYLIQAFFGISMCITAPYLWIALAILNKKTEGNEKCEAHKKTHRNKPGTAP